MNEKVTMPGTPIGSSRTPSIPERLDLLDIIIQNLEILFNYVWEDLRFPATQLKVNPATSKPVFDYTNIGYLYDADSTETLFLIAQIPHAWKEGSGIRPHIHWQPSSTNTGNVVWQLEYKWTNVNDTEASEWTALTVTTASSGVVGKHQVVSFAEIDGTDKKVSSILVLKLSRIGGNASDTYTGDALLREFDIHYLVDSKGSLMEFIK